MRALALLALIAALAAAPADGAPPMPPAPTATAQATANGTFDVTLTPEGDTPVSTMSISKTFHGDLDGSSTGRMLAVRTPVAGSAGYVAMERVTATLAGRRGSFALQHSGVMDKGAQSLSIAVVPDSGTDGLTGITGTLDIRIDAGQHFYTFHYALP